MYLHKLNGQFKRLKQTQMWTDPRLGNADLNSLVKAKRKAVPVLNQLSTTP
jgi:hypothetical protein